MHKNWCAKTTFVQSSAYRSRLNGTRIDIFAHKNLQKMDHRIKNSKVTFCVTPLINFFLLFCITQNAVAFNISQEEWTSVQNGHIF